MNDIDWYTDRLKVRRVVSARDGALTVHRRETVSEDVPCRIYRSGGRGPRMQSTAAYTEGEDKLACANEVDIRPGDELLIRRGGGLGQTRQIIRAFAGEPAYFYEPFGAVLPGLAHQEVAFLEKEYFDAEKEAEEDGGDTGGRAQCTDGGAGEAPAGDY